MLNFKKLASTLIFSILAFQSTACAVPRYAKVVLLGGKGSGKTTIQKLINKDYDISNIPHTTQISYISVPVFYDNKGNFTFDEDRDVQRYNKEVILNICDTPSENDISCDYNTEEYKKQAENNEKLLKCVDEFNEKRPSLIVSLANTEQIEISEGLTLHASDYFDEHTYELLLGGKHRKIIILTHAPLCNYEDLTEEEKEKTNDEVFKKSPLIGYLRGVFKNVSNADALKVLTLCEAKKQEKNEKTAESKDKNKIEEYKANSLRITKEVDLEFIPKMEEKFNKNSKEDLQKYADTMLNLIAQSVYKYGINNLPFNSNDSDWIIVNNKLVRGH